MGKQRYVVKAYKIRHGYDVGGFLSDYRHLLQRAIDIIWANIEWRRKDKRLIPKIPKTREFRRSLRRSLKRDWGYAANYASSAIRTAYSILKSWRRNYVKGRYGRNKPVIKRKFARVEKTLYVYRDGRLRITIKPWKQYLEFDLTKAWFRRRVEGWDLGELILKEDELVITFRKPIDSTPPKKLIAWDLNLLSMDGFCDKGWIRVDLKPLYTLHVTYENIERRIQRLSRRRPKTAKRLMEKYSKRRRSRVNDFLHKLTTKLAREFKDYKHGFEDLDKQGMYGNRKRRNREISMQPWSKIIRLMRYKAKTEPIDPRDTSKTCPRCGDKGKRRRKGRVLRCRKCGLTINRQLAAAINIYLRMRGFPTSRKAWEEMILPILRGRGVTLIGGEASDMLPMSPEGAEANAPQGGHS